MSSTISSAQAVTHVPVSTPSQPKAASGASGAPAAAKPSSSSSAQQTAALNQLLAKYKADLARGMAPSALSSLGRQIMAAATAAGQHVALPRAPATSSTPTARPVTTAASQTGKVNVTA